MEKYAIVLAAGKGTRMKSSLPKVTHKVLGKPMIVRVLETIDQVDVKANYVVVGHGADVVENLLRSKDRAVLQKEQLGTGHAVRIALEAIKNDQTIDEQDIVIIACGDTPLIRAESFKEMVSYHLDEGNAVTVMTTVVENPSGYGRIIRTDGQISAIVEEKDADELQKDICEINTGTYCFNLSFLLKEISSLNTDNAQGEFYLTDLIARAFAVSKKTGGYVLDNPTDSLGVNNRIQLYQAEKYLQERINLEWMQKGVSIQDVHSVYIEDDVCIEPDVFLESEVRLLGKSAIGEGTYIEAGSRITNATIGKNVHIKQSVINDAVVGDGCTIGPFAQLRPGTELGLQVKIGNFVEIKKSIIDNGSKVSHHTYIGDAEIGKDVNIGCGTITCNYDGTNKFKTIIGDRAFIGSNTSLIAPIRIGSDTLIGAGSTLSKNVEDNALVFNRAPIIEKKAWIKREK